METQTLEKSNMDVKKVNNSKSSELIERMPIKDTPFTIISIENEHFGTMGEYRITESFKSRGEVEDELKCITWNRIIQVIMILDNIKSKDKEFNKKVKSTFKNNKKK